VRTLALLLGALSAFGSLSIDMYLPAFPAIRSDLAASEAQVQLTLAVFFAGLGLGQAFYGPISDRYGRRRPLCFGLALFVLASAACALARSVEGLVAWRLVQSIGGCAGIVIARAVVRDRYDERDSARVFSLLLLVMGLPPILAPLVGGQILIHFGWRAVFWVLASFGLACLIAAVLILPESLPYERWGPGGPRGALRVYARLLRDHAFMRYNLASALAISGMFVYIFGSPFVFMQIHGVRPERYGLLFGLNAIGLMGASLLNRVLLGRVAGTAILSRALFVTAAAGLAIITATWTGAGGFPGLLAPVFVYISSLGFVLPNVMAAALAPQGRNAGSASALLGTCSSAPAPWWGSCWARWAMAPRCPWRPSLPRAVSRLSPSIVWRLDAPFPLPYAGPRRLPMRTLLSVLIAVAALAGCNTVAGVKEDSRQAADYTYEKKEEYQRALSSQMRELDAKIDLLRAKAARASDSVKAEFARDMDALVVAPERGQGRRELGHGLRQAGLREGQGPLRHADD